MAACTEFTCTHCGFKIESWDEGNPYLRDAEGKRHFFYHPGDQEERLEFFEKQTGRPAADEAEFIAFLNEQGGNEAHYLCLHCGRQTQRDPEHDPMRCTGCGKRTLKDTQELEGQTCPKCSQGTFSGEMTGIS